MENYSRITVGGFVNQPIKNSGLKTNKPKGVPDMALKRASDQERETFFLYNMWFPYDLFTSKVS